MTENMNINSMNPPHELTTLTQVTTSADKKPQLLYRLKLVNMYFS